MRRGCVLVLGLVLSLAFPCLAAGAHHTASHSQAHAHRVHHVRRIHHLHRIARHRQSHAFHLENTASAVGPSAAEPTPHLTRIRFVPPLRGSLASLMRQNERDDAEGLVRIENDAQLDQLEAGHTLTPLPVSLTLRVNPNLPRDRRYCRPWTAQFLADLARSHYARFHRPLQVNSAVRTVQVQRHLLEINGNAAPAAGDIASPHLTGAAVDIGKHGMTFTEISWMRGWLLPLQTAGKIDVEEEFYQACFHITVYRNYVHAAPPHSVARHSRRSTTTLLAAGVR